MENYEGRWELVKMTGSASYTETTGDNMEWQEYYFFNNDQTFSKTRMRGDSVTTATGTYVFSEEHEFMSNENNEVIAELVYDTINPLIGTCYNTRLMELLYISNGKMISTWHQCDGPGLEYEK
ncbi:hypothetical protein L1I30_05360 [Gillisia sp. M10.2A]|uniref:Lipocalin-like domain-containing protein n=1 Tax=Gillisia lutea TaxID=2909668 RepID=A0ABS9EGX5_9FLAO|nr:hypothetical protein [Gillisia lutea]MCF4101084.1 hypothetical protein [Gillisia lutea]